MFSFLNLVYFLFYLEAVSSKSFIIGCLNFDLNLCNGFRKHEGYRILRKNYPMFERIVYPPTFDVQHFVPTESYTYYFPSVQEKIREAHVATPEKYVMSHADHMEGAKIKREDVKLAQLKKGESEEASYEKKKEENEKENEESYHKQEEKTYEQEFHKSSGDKKDKKYDKVKKYASGNSDEYESDTDHKKDGEYKTKKKNKKGKKKTGYQNLYVKNESKMKHKFYDVDHEAGKHSNSKNSKKKKHSNEKEASEKKYGRKYSKEY